MPHPCTPVPRVQWTRDFYPGLVRRIHAHLTVYELHVNPSFASITVHEEVVDLVDEVLLLERDEVLLAAARSFHVVFVYFFGHYQPGILVFLSPPDIRRGFALSVGPKESNLCVFKVQFLACFNNRLPRSIVAFCHCFNNDLPRSIGH